MNKGNLGSVRLVPCCVCVFWGGRGLISRSVLMWVLRGLVTGEFALLSLHYHILLQILGFRFSLKVREDRHPVHTSI